MKGKIYAIVSSIVLFVAVVGATLALIYYRSDVTEVNIKTEPELGTFINYISGDDIIGDDGKTLEVGNHYTSGLSTEIELWKIEEARNMDIYSNIYLNIKNGSEELLNMPALKWAVTSNDILISEGNFMGSSQGENIPILINHKLLTTVTKFKVYVWIDDSEEKNSDAEGETLNVSVWCEATSNELSFFDIMDFNYTGHIENVNLPPGSYTFEVWGAQGGYGYDETYRGGYGGYSKGEITLDSPTSIYVAVGGQGVNSVEKVSALNAGGFNGGGDTYGNTSKYLGSGGGATHIALSNGILSSLSSNIDDILIVAGGGGAGGYESSSYTSTGGDGGGYIGNNGTSKKPTYTVGYGGTQSAGGTGYIVGMFGQGANTTSNSIGGGGGFYGGGAGKYASGSGGGSGYIGNPLLTEKIMYCYNCKDSSEEADEINIKTVSTTNVSETAVSNYAKTGDGYARITSINSFKSLSRKEIIYGTDYNFKNMLSNELGQNLNIVYSSYENANELGLGEYQIRYIAVDENSNEYTYYQKIEIVG